MGSAAYRASSEFVGPLLVMPALLVCWISRRVPSALEAGFPGVTLVVQALEAPAVCATTTLLSETRVDFEKPPGFPVARLAYFESAVNDVEEESALGVCDWVPGVVSACVKNIVFAGSPNDVLKCAVAPSTPHCTRFA